MFEQGAANPLAFSLKVAWTRQINLPLPVTFPGSKIFKTNSSINGR